MFQARLFARIISKNREVYLLKIITLAIAFASTTLITSFSLTEFGYDRFHSNPQAVFRVLQRNNREEFSGNRFSSKIPEEVYHALSALKDSLAVARVKVMNGIDVAVNRTFFHDQKIHAADPALLSIFSFDVSQGSSEDFTVSNPVLLSEKMSVQYFGTTQSVGNILKFYTLTDTLAYKVAAVFHDFPANSHEEFNVLLRFDPKNISSLHFSESDFNLYGRLHGGTKTHHENRLNAKRLFTNTTYSFQTISDIYFGPRVTGEEARHGDVYSIWILLCVTGLALFLALASFVNLTTLTLPHRAKELAVKKLAGTSQRMILFAFAKESFVLVSISFAFGIILLLSVNSFIESILLINIGQLLLGGDLSILLMAALLICISCLAPLLLANKFAHASPTRLLSTDTISFPRFKKVITVLQLGISIFLIIASIVIRRQVNYSLLKEPGRNHDQIVSLNYPQELTNQGLSELRAHWKQINPNIQDVMATSQLPHLIQSKELDSDLYLMSVDRGFLDFFNLNIQQGRWFRANDESPLVVVNSAAQLPVNQEIIGVIENMGKQFNQPQKPIKYLVTHQANYNFLCVRVLEVNIRETVTYLSNYFPSTGSSAPVTFLDKHFEDWLRYQDRLNRLSKLLAIISGVLSCFAIYGLSLSFVRDKLKQIAIHKLYGASILRITRLLAQEFILEMVIALLIFGPLTYVFLHEFLRNFVYTTKLQWSDSLYPLSYCVLVIVALCGFQAISLNRTDLTGALKS